MRFLLSKMNPKPSDKEIKDFLGYQESEKDKLVLVPGEVMAKMKEDIANIGKKKGKKGDKKGKKGKKR